MRYHQRDCDDFKVMLPGSNTKVLILRRWNDAMSPWWCMFYDDGIARIATYEPRCKTAEEAIAKFIKYEIEGHVDPTYDHGRIRRVYTEQGDAYNADTELGSLVRVYE